jgi:hypothetical protein
MECDVTLCDNVFCVYPFSEIKHIKCAQQIMRSAGQRRKFHIQNKEQTVNDLPEQFRASHVTCVYYCTGQTSYGPIAH